jgi:uncharacterized repeat protein (TIGR01451 family)
MLRVARRIARALLAALPLFLLVALFGGCTTSDTNEPSEIGITAQAYSTSPVITTQRTMSAATAKAGDTISVTLTVNVGAIGTSPLKGFYVSEYLPAGYTVASSSVTLNGAAVSGVIRETDAVGSVYSDATTERWVLETPTAFSQNHPVSQSSTLVVSYGLKVPATATPGTVTLKGFSWVAMIPSLGTTGDHFGYEDSPPTITIASNAAPTVAAAAAASPAAVTAKTTALSALGADDQGETGLTYTWATTGTPPAAVTFAPNGTNAAKSTTATFSKAGSYSLQVTIKDGGNLTVTSSVSVTVSQTATAIAVTPASASVAVGGSTQFTAVLQDQFAVAITPAPTFTWQVAGGGTIGNSGLFTAGATVGGPYAVSAKSGSFTATASVTVTGSEAPLTIASSTSGAAQTPSTYAHDGDAASRYTNDNTLATAWITLNLAQTSTVSRLSLLMYSGATRTYPIRVSVGSTVVFTGTTALTGTAWSLPISPTSGSSVTITMTGPNSAGSSWFSIFEAQVFGSGGSPPAPTCSDGIKNQTETDVDCGGTVCGTCANGKACLVAADCTSATCTAGVCSAPPGGETQIAITSAIAGGAVQTPAINAIDGNETSRYTNDGTLATASIKLQIASAASISKLRLLMFSSANRTYPIRVSVGSTVVFTGSTATAAGYWELPITPTSGTEVTITMTAANSAGSNWFSIFEAKLLGTL